MPANGVALISAISCSMRFENRLANVEASLMVLNWMVGFNLILTVAIVGMLFFVLANELAANAAATTDALFNPS
jgi:hypothetical protein